MMIRPMTCLAIAAFLVIAARIAMTSVPAHSAEADGPKKAAPKPVPFKLASPDKPLILLEAMVDEKGPFRFVLDTGAGGTIISPPLAKRLGIKPDKRSKPDKAVGAGGQVEVHPVRVKSLQVGEVRLEGLGAAILDLTGISKALGTDIDGILGFNFLSRFRVTIDYPKQTVTFE